jgi:hypothetical protein
MFDAACSVAMSVASAAEVAAVAAVIASFAVAAADVTLQLEAYTL